MKLFSHLQRSSGAIMVAMAAFVCAVPTSAEAAYADGDVFLCFRATAGTGASTDYLVDIGPATQFTNATGRFEVNLGGDILADLVATYGANWNSRPEVRWSVVGVQKTTSGLVAANTIFASRREPAAGTPSAPWQRPSTFTAGTPAGKIQAMGSRYNLGTTSNGGTQTVSTHNPNALLQATGITTSYAQFQPGGVSTTGATAFAYFDDTTGIEGTFTGGNQNNAVDFYTVAPGAGDAELLGGFRVTKAGTLIFDTDSTRLLNAPVGIPLYSKAGPVPTNVGIPSGATWTGFGPPAVNDHGQVAFVGKWKAPAPNKPGAGIFVDGTLVVKTGDATGITGVTFKGFKDPVIDNLGHVAFIGSVTGTGISSTNDLVVATNGRAGAIEILAQEGAVAADAGGATYKTFTAVSIKGEHSLVVPPNSASGVVFFGSLTKLTGTPPVDTKNDSVAWWLPQGGDHVVKIIRESDPSSATLGAPTFKTFNILKALGGSPAHGRGQIAGDECLLQVVLSNNAQGFVDATVSAGITSTSFYALTGDSLHSTAIADAKWSKMNFQSSDASGQFQSTVGTLQVIKGGTVTSQQAKGIFTTGNASATWEPVARTAAADAPGMGTGAKFASFKDPVNSSTDAGLAFIGAAKGGAVLPPTDNGIWWQPAGSTLSLLVREGGEPPLAPGAKYKVFSSLALPGGSTGPLFAVLLEKGLAGAVGPGGVTSANDSAVYGVDALGALLQVMREGSPITGISGKNVKVFNVLKVVSGTAGATRCFNDGAHVLALVTFSDSSVSIVDLAIPF